MDDPLQDGDKLGQDLVEGAHEREAARQSSESGQPPNPSDAPNSGATGGQTGPQDPIDRLKDKTGSGPKGNLGSRLGGAAKGAGRFIGQHKKPAVISGGAIGLIVGGFIGLSGFFTIFEAVHVAENVKQDVMKKLDHMEQKGSEKVLKAILKHAAMPKGTGTPSPNDPVAENIASTDARGLKADLQANNITESFNANGELTSLTGEGGKPLNLETDPAATTAAAEAVPTVEAEIRTDFQPTLHYQDGVNFDFITGNDTQDINKEIGTDVRDGVTTPLDENTSKPSDGSTPPKGSTVQESGTIGEVDKAFQATGDPVAAADKGIKSMFSGGFARSIEVTILTIMCDVQQIISNGDAHRYATLSKELMRSSNVLFSIADQSKSGHKMSLKVLGSFISTHFNGNSKAMKPEAQKSFDQSAGWKSVTGQPVTSANPTINPAADPNASNSNLMSDLATGFGNSFIATFENYGCGFVTNTFGNLFITVIDDIGNLIATVFSGGADIEAQGAAKITLTVALQNLGENIAKYGAITAGTNAAVSHSSYLTRLFDKLSNLILIGADLVVTGNDDAVQFLNQAKLGGDMSANTSARSLGGHRLTKTASLKLAAVADHERSVALARTSLWNQTFSLANVNSVASKFLIKMPFTKEQALADLFQLPHMPKLILGNIKSIFIPRASAAAADFSNSQQFGFTDEELNRYDVYTNSAYMTDPAQGVSVPLTATTSVMVPRDYILGDPSKYTPTQNDIPTCAGTSDGNGNTTNASSCPQGSFQGAVTNYNDFIGCYVNAVQDPKVARGTVCGDMLDFAETDNPTNIPDSIFVKMYCDGVPSITANGVTNSCSIPSGVHDEMTHYGIFLLDYHLSSTLKSYANAKMGVFQ